MKMTLLCRAATNYSAGYCWERRISFCRSS